MKKFLFNRLTKYLAKSKLYFFILLLLGFFLSANCDLKANSFEFIKSNADSLTSKWEPFLNKTFGNLFLDKEGKWIHLYGSSTKSIIKDDIIDADSTSIIYKRISKKITTKNSESIMEETIDTIILRLKKIEPHIYEYCYDLSKCSLNPKKWSNHKYLKKDTITSVLHFFSESDNLEQISIYELNSNMILKNFDSFSNLNEKSLLKLKDFVARRKKTSDIKNKVYRVEIKFCDLPAFGFMLSKNGYNEFNSIQE